MSVTIHEKIRVNNSINIILFPLLFARKPLIIKGRSIAKTNSSGQPSPNIFSSLITLFFGKNLPPVMTSGEYKKTS